MKYIEKHPMLMIVIGVIGISLSAIFVKYSTAPAVVTAAWRLLWTVILLVPAAMAKPAVRKELAALPRKTVLLSLLSGLFLAAHFGFWFESLNHTTVAASTTIVCTEVIWVCIGFCMFLGGKLSKNAVAAIAVTLLGSLLIAWSDSAAGTGLYGDILSLIAAIAVAVYTLIGRVVRETASTTAYTTLVYSACAAALTAVALLQGHDLLGFGPAALVVGLLLAVFSTLLGHSIFNWCLKFFSPSFVSATKLCEPVGAAILAAILFAEFPTPLQLLGGALILAGVLWYSRLESKGE